MRFRRSLSRIIDSQTPVASGPEMNQYGLCVLPFAEGLCIKPMVGDAESG